MKLFCNFRNCVTYYKKKEKNFFEVSLAALDVIQVCCITTGHRALADIGRT